MRFAFTRLGLAGQCPFDIAATEESCIRRPRRCAVPLSCQNTSNEDVAVTDLIAPTRTTWNAGKAWNKGLLDVLRG